MSQQEDLASIIARGQRQITTAGSVPVRLRWLRLSPGHSAPPARSAVMLDMSRPFPGSVAA
jgi:hypothetical protein